MPALGDQLVGPLDEGHPESGAGADLHDPGAHETAPDDPDMPNVLRFTVFDPSERRKVRTIAEMSRHPTVRPATLLGLALAGVLVGHALTYRVRARRRALPVRKLFSGDSYLGGANMLGLVAAVVALSILFLGRLVRGTDATPRVAVRLMAFQLTTFAAMEVLERLGSGAGVRQLLPALLVGIPTQVVVAGIVALIVRCTFARRRSSRSNAAGIGRVVRRIARSDRSVTRRRTRRPCRRRGARSRASLAS